MSDQSENIRKKYLYRRLIMTKKIKLARKSATGLVGPDCAYHLYSQMPTKKTTPLEPPRTLPEEG